MRNNTKRKGDTSDLPSPIAAEGAVLGSILQDTASISAVATWLRPEHFYIRENAEIFDSMLTLYRRGTPPDLVSVAGELERRGATKETTLLADLFALSTITVTSANISYYGHEVESAAVMRRLIGVGTEIVMLGGDKEKDVSDALAEAARLVADVSSRTEHSAPSSLDEVLDDHWKQVEVAFSNNGALVGIPTGIYDLDRITGGLRDSELVILASRPGVGKSAMAMGIGQHAAERGNCVLVFSLEMSKVTLARRMIAAATGIDSQRLSRGRLRKEEWEHFMECEARLSQLPIYLDDARGLTVHDLRAKAHTVMLKRSIDLVIVDYLQLLRGTPRRNATRQEEVAELSSGLRQLAGEIKVPILACAQLNRLVEMRADKRPMLSDLRESGSIEADADLVLLLHREDVYRKADEWTGDAELIIAKHRNGALGQIPLKFIAEQARYVNMDTIHPPHLQRGEESL